MVYFSILIVKNNSYFYAQLYDFLKPMQVYDYD